LTNEDPKLRRRPPIWRSGPHALRAATLFEFLFGIHLKYEDEGLAELVCDVEDFLSAFVVLPLDQEAAKLAAQMAARLRRSGEEIGIQDVHLAATAIRNKSPSDGKPTALRENARA
jgi:predicted nucleic acid-binding protein